VLSDHLNLKTFLTTKKLNRREARWAQKLASFDFIITHIPGRENGRADALTRRSGDLPEEGDERRNSSSSILRPENFSNLAIAALNRLLARQIKSALSLDPEAQSILQALKDNSRHHPKIPIGECEFHDELLHFDGLVYVPNDLELQRRVIESCHDHPAAGHPGVARTYEMVTRDFWWPGMRKTIIRYVKNCDVCARIKPGRHAPYGFLRPLEVPQKRWDSISMDFIVGLPPSEGYDSVLVVVDRLTKMAHFIPTTATIQPKDLARIFHDGFFRLHGLPQDITSDRGSLFTSAFWKALGKRLSIKGKLSTAFHPQTDGQTERTNAQLEQYIRGYCNYQQDNWAELISMAEFSYNNSASTTTGVTPFFANYGYHPRYDLVPVPSSAPPAPAALIEYTSRLENLREHLQAEMKFAQSEQAEHANQHRSAPPDFRVGDFVWLIRRHIKTKRPSSKLDYKRLGRFQILEKVSSHAYKLDLPPSMKVHPVFHISLLEPTSNDPLPGQVLPPPPPIEVDEEQYWEVEEVLDSRRYRNRLQYLVRWVGYSEPTWEPPEHLSTSPDLVRLVHSFHEQYPRKPRPRRLVLQ
jgi:hypothetical protein